MIDLDMEETMNCGDDFCDLQGEVNEECQHLEPGRVTFYCELGDRRCKDGCYKGLYDGDLMCYLE